MNADQTVFMYGIGFDDLTFDTFVSANATSFVYLTPNGHRVAVSGNFVFPGAADEPTGAITSVQINLGNDVDIDYEITGIAGVDVSAIYTSPTTNLPDLLLSGTDTINTVAGVDNYLVADGAFSVADSVGAADFINVTGDGHIQWVYGDFGNALEAGSHFGGEDHFVITGDFLASRFIGDSNVYTDQGSVLHAADDLFTIGPTTGSPWVIGDSFLVLGTLIGGNDTFDGGGAGAIVIGDARQVGGTFASLPQSGGVAGGNDTIAAGRDQIGDVAELIAGVVVGGDDTMTAVAGVTERMIGDVQFVTGNGQAAIDLFAGDDSMTGSVDDDLIVGDIFNVLSAGSTTNIVFGDDDIQGGGGNDHLYGDYISNLAGVISPDDGGNDILNGGDGHDSIYGQGGDDWVIGGDGNNYIDGGNGNDIAVYWLAGGAVTVDLTMSGVYQNTIGAGNDNLNSVEGLLGSLFSDTLTGDGSDNIISGFAGHDTLAGGGGNDTAAYLFDLAGVSVDLNLQGAGQNTGGSGVDELSGFENLLGSQYDDTLIGDGGDNVIDGADGDDTLVGGGGNDTVSYGASTLGVIVDLSQNGVAQNTGGAGIDTISGFENLRGSNHNDSLTGNGFANVIEGGAGGDDIEGMAGADTLVGGDGIDTLSYEHSNAGVIVGLDGVVGIGGHAQGDVISGFERLIGSAFDDILSGTADANEFNGLAGQDTLDYTLSDAAISINLNLGLASGGHAEGDTFAFIENVTGSSFDDTIFGSNSEANTLNGGGGVDLLAGLDGDDTLNGGEGDDSLAGGNDNDELNGENGNDRLFGNSGNDTINGGAGDDLTNGGDGDDIINGGADDDNVLVGGAGNDTIHGDDGNDGLDGSSGDDYLYGDSGNDRLYGGSGIDRLYGGAGDDTMSGMSDTDYMHGSFGDDGMNGGGGDDVLNGNSGDDRLFGGLGADTLNGGADNDLLVGQGGIDTFVFEANWGHDQISGYGLDVTGQPYVDEVIDMSALGIDFADLTIQQSGVHTLVYITADGGATNSIEILYRSVTDITQDDFLF